MNNYSHIQSKPRLISLHLNPTPEFTRKGFGKKVTQAGGKWFAARGSIEHRYVTLPLGCPGTEALVDELLARFPTHKTTTVIFRGTYHIPAWVEVRYIAEGTEKPFAAALEQRTRALQSAVKRGVLPDIVLAA